jgi:hypothetical protein
MASTGGDMTTLATGDLQALAAFAAEEPCAISVHLNLDPALAPIAQNLSSRVNSLVNEARRQAPVGASHEARMQFDSALARVESFLGDPSNYVGNRTRGVGVFASGNGLSEAKLLPHPVADAVKVGRRLALVPVVAAASIPDDLMILLVSREQGRLLRLRGGELAEVFDDFERAERRHDQGGWEQADLQRWHDQAAKEHVERVVDHFERVHHEAGRPPLLLAADEETARVARQLLGREASERLFGQVGNERDWSNDRLIEQGERVLSELRRTKEERLLERWREQLGQANGRGTGAPAATIAAVSDSRVEWLLVSRRETPRVYECVTCGRLYAEAGSCELDGAPLRMLRDGLDALVAGTVVAGGCVWQLGDPDRDDLDPAGGIAAITRF